MAPWVLPNSPATSVVFRYFFPLISLISESTSVSTERVKGYARNRGADLVGITEINPLWLYSHRGEIFHENWQYWGKEIKVEHKYAIVFATEMSFEMVGTGPHSPTMIESMGNYAQGAYIATQLAHFIANLGYCYSKSPSPLRCTHGPAGSRCRSGGVGSTWVFDHQGAWSEGKSGRCDNRSPSHT